jgi:hypothetical protein
MANVPLGYGSSLVEYPWNIPLCTDQVRLYQLLQKPQYQGRVHVYPLLKALRCLLQQTMNLSLCTLCWYQYSMHPHNCVRGATLKLWFLLVSWSGDLCRHDWTDFVIWPLQRVTQLHAVKCTGNLLPKRILVSCEPKLFQMNNSKSKLLHSSFNKSQ